MLCWEIWERSLREVVEQTMCRYNAVDGTGKHMVQLVDWLTCRTGFVPATTMCIVRESHVLYEYDTSRVEPQVGICRIFRVAASMVCASNFEDVVTRQQKCLLF